MSSGFKKSRALGEDHSSFRRVRFVFAVQSTARTIGLHLPLTLSPSHYVFVSHYTENPSRITTSNMSQEQDPFVGEGGEDDTLIMAPLLVEKLQVCPSALSSTSVAAAVPL